MTDALPDEDGATTGEAAPEPARRPRPRPFRWAVAVAVMAGLAAVLVPPVAEVTVVVATAGSDAGVDSIVTGSVRTPRTVRYTVRRSVLLPAGESCTTFANGTVSGPC